MDADTRDEIRDMREVILSQMRDGFQGVYLRQDKTNGRVEKVEQVTAQHTADLRNLKHEVYRRRLGDRDEGENRAIRQREVKLVVLGGAGLIGALKFLVWIGPALKALVP